jgi:hypothetical protein
MDKSVTLSLKAGMEYLLRFAETKSWEIPPDLQSRISALKMKHLHTDLMASKSINPDVPKFKSEYKATIIAAILLYATDPNLAELAFDFAMITAFSNIFLSSWHDAGAQLPPNIEASQWLAQREEQERVYITGLFVGLALLLKQPDFDLNGWAETRAEGYLSTLNGIESVGILRAKVASGHGDDLYLFQGESGSESCKECQDLLGKKMKASDIIARDLIPFPGSTSFSCGGWKCQHFWMDAKGKVLSV